MFIAVLILVEWIQRDKQHALQLDGQIKSPLLRYAIYYAIISVLFWQAVKALSLSIFSFKRYWYDKERY